MEGMYEAVLHIGDFAYDMVDVSLCLIKLSKYCVTKITFYRMMVK